MNRRTAGAIIVTAAALAMLAVAALSVQGCSGAALTLNVLDPTQITSEPLTPADEPETPPAEPEPEPPPSGGDTPGTSPPAAPESDPPPSGVGPEPGAPVSTPQNEGETGADPPQAPLPGAPLAPANCCGCACGEDGCLWMVKTGNDECQRQGRQSVPGLCGCTFWRDPADPNDDFAHYGVGC